MDIKKFIDRSLEIKKLYAEFEKNKYGKEWTSEKYFESLVADVGDLSRLIMTEKDSDDENIIRKKIEHELADLLFGIFILADYYDVDIEKAFFGNAKNLEEKIKQ